MSTSGSSGVGAILGKFWETDIWKRVRIIELYTPAETDGFNIYQGSVEEQCLSTAALTLETLEDTGLLSIR